MMSGFSRPIGDLVDVDQDADALSPNHLATYVGTYDNTYFGTAQVEIENGGLTIILGPNSQRFSLAAWDGNIFAVAPHGENAPAGSLSSVKFTTDRQVASFVIEYLNGNGLGTWTRSQ